MSTETAHQTPRYDIHLERALDEGYTLPSECYTSQAQFEAEKRRIFHQSWQYLAHADQLAKPGDFVATRMGDIPIVATRDNAGELRAFANVCRHRGSEVVLEASGNRQTLQCHYHGWTYGLEGSLRSAPRAREQVGFHPERCSLVPFRVKAWGQVVFASPGAEGKALSEVLADLPEIFLSAVPNLESVRFRRRDTYQLQANWKIVIENFNECYHCPVAHPEFSKAIDVERYQVDTSREYFSFYRGPLVSAPEEAVTYATLWPNTMLMVGTNPTALLVMQALPMDENRTHEIFDYYFAPETPAEMVDRFVEMSDLVQQQDIVLCESVHRGLRSGVVPQGQLMLSRERGIQHFQKLVHRFMAED